MRLNDFRTRLDDAREQLGRLTAPLTRLCEFLLVHWPLYLLLCLALLMLAFLPMGFLMLGLPYEPSWWWTLLTGLTALPVMLGLNYMLHPLPPSPGWRFSRQPLSSLGEAEVVLADTSLLTDGLREILVAAPLELTAELRKRPEVISLAVAMAYTAQLQNRETEPLLLDAASALGLNHQNLTRLRPVVGKTWLGPIPGVIVEDGKGQTSYFVGDPMTLSGMCAAIDGHHPRPLTAAEQAAIHESTQALRQQGALVLGFASMESASALDGPVYLGLLALRDVVNEDAALAVQALLEAGYSLQTQPIDKAYLPPMRLAALRQRLGMTDALYAPHVILSTDLLETPALCIAAADHRHRRFDGPVLLAREWFGKMAAWMRILLGCALPLLLACVLGAAHPLCALGALTLLVTALSAAASDDRHWDIACLALLGVALPLWCFLLLTGALAAGPVMGLYALTAALTIALHLSQRWQITLICAVLGLIFLALGWALPGLSLLAGLLALLAGALGGVIAGQLLRFS